MSAKNGSSYEREYADRFGTASSAAEERRRWEEWCRDLLQQRDALQSALEETRVERDELLNRMLQRVPTPAYQFTEQELRQATAGQPSLEEFLKEIRRGEGL